MGNAGLDDELQTAIKEVEARMNSRPLFYEGTDPRDEPVLTLSHFFIGQLEGQGTSRTSISRARWSGACCPSEHKRPQAYPSNYPTVAIERLR